MSHRTSIKDGLGRHIGSCGPLNRSFPKGRKRTLPQYITVNKEKIRLDVYVYECVHGKLPTGYSVIHLDNDLNNNNIDNLRAAPKEIRRLFSGAGYSKMPQVLAPALYAQVMLRHAIKRLSS
ncbi:HNH endonuclease [Klebsiella quasipneumoniae]|uniref:HNH endonuclease n=1 Tax=Klebsiella quasipneumoniae TaxID=1463165 RepID=UPI0029E82644|nr:HNH endonuclease [Klebsiella quasipneumoniae]